MNCVFVLYVQGTLCGVYKLHSKNGSIQHSAEFGCEQCITASDQEEAMLFLLYIKHKDNAVCLCCPRFTTSAISSECARLTERLADDEACKALMGAAAQCVYLLYGLDLTERDEQWTDEFQVSMLVLVYLGRPLVILVRLTNRQHHLWYLPC